ncbi:class I adenylate-forming enzyme family protein [Actinomadura opuntiae]|uniref:class I adenylate-forming enzyme family protein n=1 Tax=Actinomadura sp. OS1-43 TaxID=604315 RepID=UPI00255AF7AD|nr:class I adenylate-forming enzyme family protein [Actinomadura sp. OS1-43]MDL4814326.1 class I adenylate-forming enzyme family protein [Actinomadura sp. OS1-43]
MTRPFDQATVSEYRAAGWWGTETVADHVRRQAVRRPAGAAHITVAGTLSWSGYEEHSTRLARHLAGLGLAPGERVAALLPDGPAWHVTAVAAEKAGLVLVGAGARAGRRELRFLLERTGSKAMVTLHAHRGEPSADLVAALRADGVDLVHHVVVDRLGLPDDPRDGDLTARALGPDDLAIINSTSGTTGLPKCVSHTQNRWFYFHELARRAGALTPEDVFLGAVPSPFGFGLWSAHFSPAVLGVPTVLMERFDAHAALDLIERHRVTVLHCVTTQFIMLLNAQEEKGRDLGSLRCMFTGGEAVPYERAARFEEATGAKVLQFYGSNETGALSRTTLDDPREVRLRTAGHVIPEMRVRLFDPADGSDITGSGRPGQPGCKGPAASPGYYDDPEADRALFTPDGWMLMADIVEIDAAGRLRVVGRQSDLIIRGGKNISAAAVEAEVGTHPAVALAAAVAMPDQVFGERVCVYAELRPGAALDLDGLTGHLTERGVSREWHPERLVVLNRLPRSSGGKVAKSELRADIRRRLGG